MNIEQLSLEGDQVIDEPGKNKNTGKDLEQAISEAAAHYSRGKLLYIEKTDPPVQVLRFGGRVNVIMKRNPWLDFAGVWTEYRGRTIIIEAKSMSSHRLAFQREGGITERQVKYLSKWHHAGAFVGILFEWRGQGVRWFNYKLLSCALNSGAKSLVWEDGWPVGMIDGILDFRSAMIEAARKPDILKELREYEKRGGKIKFWTCPKGCQGYVEWSGELATCKVCGATNKTVVPQIEDTVQSGS